MSTFTNLLRQSKFASYDPAIHQAYTSFGGYAHRGHWGMKRDLPPRRKHKISDPLVSSSGARGSPRRNPVAFISSLDSAEGQTEWKSAEKDVRWLRRLEELGTCIKLHDASTWTKRIGSFRGKALGLMDSEFGADSSDQDIGQRNTSALPNIQAMSERRFRSYIDRLRTRREAFHEFLQDARIGQDEGVPGRLQVVPMYYYAQTPTALHTQFLAHENAKAAKRPDSHTLTPVPHPSAGLDYLNPSPLTTMLLYPNSPKGRYVQNNHRSALNRPNIYEGAAIVSVAGYNANLRVNATTQAIDWQKLAEGDFSQSLDQATSEYRVQELSLRDVPQVVGRSQQGISGANISMHIEDCSKLAERQANPYRPGSFDYISHEDKRTFTAAPVSFRSSTGYESRPNAASNRPSILDNTSTEMLDILDSLLASSSDASSKKP